jgi:hypothetical protein
MGALHEAFYMGAVMCFVAAICSALRGKTYVNGQEVVAQPKKQ